MQTKKKYYLNYLQPPVLDRKKENRDIKVVEQASIPRISKLDDAVTPLRLLKLFFDDVLVDMIVGYIKLYISHREKADISHEITNEKKLLILKHATAQCRRVARSF